MSPVNSKLKFLLIILFLQSIFCLTIAFNIPIIRQVIGFLCITFIPGFILIKLLKMHELDRIETLLLSVGFSVAILMLFGLLINESLFLFGVSQPLSLIPLMITLNSLILIGGALAHLRSEKVKLCTISLPHLSPFVLFLVCLPILSVLGAISVKVYGSNFILLIMIVMIALTFVIGVLLRRLMQPYYPFAVVIIAVSLLWHSSLISDNMITFGSDVAGEVLAFKIVEKDARWSPINPYFPDIRFGKIYAMLSVTILPLIYSNLLNMDIIWVFKVLYPLIFALVPLCLYKLWSGFVGEKYAFISAFFFMAYETFYTEMLGLNRQMISELFIVLLLLVILNKKMKTFSKTFCFLIFTFALVTSHYALAEIFLFFLFSIFISLTIMRKTNRNITLNMILSFFAIMFLWYLYISNSAVFNSFLETGEYIRNRLDEFFNIKAREPTILRGLGLESPPTIWNMISRIFAYITQFLIVVGFFGVIIKKEFDFETKYLLFIFFSMIFLVALILIPGLADIMNMTRFYHVLLFFLAPLCALGAKTIIKIIGSRKREMMVSLLLLAVLVPYLLFQIGFVYEVTGSDSWSVPLSMYRMPAYRLYGHFGYVTDYNVLGARWVASNVVMDHVQIYADLTSRSGDLRCYGVVYARHIEVLSNVTRIKSGGVVYLSSLNVIEGVFVGSYYLWNISELSFLSDLSILYSSGGCKIYKNTP